MCFARIPPFLGEHNGDPRSLPPKFRDLAARRRGGRSCLLECTDAVSGIPRYVICAVGREAMDYRMTPFGHLHDGDPFKAYIPPR
jgi:hypothetical protein